MILETTKDFLLFYSIIFSLGILGAHRFRKQNLLYLFFVLFSFIIAYFLLYTLTALIVSYWDLDFDTQIEFMKTIIYIFGISGAFIIFHEFQKQYQYSKTKWPQVFVWFLLEFIWASVMFWLMIGLAFSTKLGLLL